MWNLFDIAVFAAGFAACWFGKDTLVKWYQGASTFAANLEAKAAKIKAAL
ncbi:MAG TPA: hypothetical protein VN815_13220 [Steroidobacteraceae bacterium]|nr:hypothetical protein [Steroidobacteraceae bacterium]